MADRPIQVGDLVRLIGTDGFMPPLGALGSVLSPEDSDGEHDVEFFGYPCPNPPGMFWVSHKSWLRVIPPDALKDETPTREEIEA